MRFLNDLACFLGVLLCVICLCLILERNECRCDNGSTLEQYQILKGQNERAYFTQGY